jgi:hypothetical protein
LFSVAAGVSPAFPLTSQPARLPLQKSGSALLFWLSPQVGRLHCDIGSGGCCTCLAPKARFIRSLRQRRRKRMSKGEALKAPIKTRFSTKLSLRKRKADSRFQR